MATIHFPRPAISHNHLHIFFATSFYHRKNLLFYRFYVTKKALFYYFV